MRILNEAELLKYSADEGDAASNLGEFSEALELAEVTDLETENPGELSPLQKAADLGLSHHVQVMMALVCSWLDHFHASVSLVLLGLGGIPDSHIVNNMGHLAAKGGSV